MNVLPVGLYSEQLSSECTDQNLSISRIIFTYFVRETITAESLRTSHFKDLIKRYYGHIAPYLSIFRRSELVEQFCSTCCFRVFSL